MPALSLAWSPPEVGAGYLTGGGFSNGTADLCGYGTVVGRAVGDASIVLHFENIVRTASMAVSCILQRLMGTSLIDADKNCMECFIISSDVTVS